jgi:NAD(P)-dependent dehydrogenase (short-subunit alcohol dehydrogenase family)
MKLQGKVAIITGAARGIGHAIARRYAEEGASVVIADLDEAAAQAAAAGIGPAALALRLDVTRQDSIDAAMTATVARFGRLDILVNNAGIFDLAPIVDITRASYARVFAVNVEGLLFTLQAAARQMIAQNESGRGGGRIINFASQAGRRGEALVGVYCASKAAVISLTQSAGLDLIRHGINVNAIAPGVVDAEHWDDVDARFARAEGLLPGEKKRRVGEAVPIGRMAQPEEIAGLAVFLAGDDAGYVVAQTYGIDGGNWMS